MPAHLYPWFERELRALWQLYVAIVLEGIGL
jgi:hypothetical protein